MSRKYINKKDRIINLLNNLEYFKTKKEGVDYILQYKPRHGWIIKEVVMEVTKGQFLEVIIPTFKDFNIGKNYACIKRHADKAMFAWRVFGESRELLNVKEFNVK
jgi:hypothetical protein